MKYREFDQSRVVGLAQGANTPHPLLRATDLDADRLLSFVHIPKTAGTTLYSYLDTKFLPQQVFPADRAGWHARGMEQMHPQDIGEFRCLRGHLYAPQLKRFTDATRKTIVPFTVLRHPEAQLLSEYDMICNDPNAPAHREALEANLTFDQFLEDSRFSVLAGDLPQLAHLRLHNRQSAHLLLQTELNPYTIPEHEWFDLLMERLDSYLLVGIQERLEQAVHLLAFLLGWHCHCTLPVLNKACGTRLGLTAAQRARLQETNAIDFQLYAWALDRFQHQYAAMLEQLEAAGAVANDMDGLVAALNRHGDERIRQRAFGGVLGRDDYEVINTTGLLLGHVSRDVGRQLNWIGPEPKATMRLAFPGTGGLGTDGTSIGRRVLQIEILYWLTQAMLDDFYVKVNGHSIPLVRHQHPSACQFVGFLPEDVLGPVGTFVDVEMGTSSVGSPAELGLNSLDREQKCLALAAFQCFPATIPALGLLN